MQHADELALIEAEVAALHEQISMVSLVAAALDLDIAKALIGLAHESRETQALLCALEVEDRDGT